MPLELLLKLTLVVVQHFVVGLHEQKLGCIGRYGFEDPAEVALLVAGLHVVFVNAQTRLVKVRFFQRAAELLGLA